MAPPLALAYSVNSYITLLRQYRTMLTERYGVATLGVYGMEKNAGEIADKLDQR